jgi:hypothetical protein
VVPAARSIPSLVFLLMSGVVADRMPIGRGGCLDDAGDLRVGAPDPPLVQLLIVPEIRRM